MAERDRVCLCVCVFSVSLVDRIYVLNLAAALPLSAYLSVFRCVGASSASCFANGANERPFLPKAVVQKPAAGRRTVKVDPRSQVKAKATPKKRAGVEPKTPVPKKAKK